MLLQASYISFAKPCNITYSWHVIVSYSQFLRIRAGQHQQSLQNSAYCGWDVPVGLQELSLLLLLLVPIK